MACGRHQLLDHSWVGRCPVGAHLGRVEAVLQGAGEEPASGRQVPLLGDQDVNDLAVLVDCPVQLDPPPDDFHICLVDEPAIARCMPAGSGRVDQQRGESLHPTIDGHVINVDTAFGQQLLDISVRQPVPQISAHSNHDHTRRNRNPANPDLGAGTREGRRRILPPCLSPSSVNATDPG